MALRAIKDMEDAVEARGESAEKFRPPSAAPAAPGPFWPVLCRVFNGAAAAPAALG
jgi:hypothetical protein